MVNIHVYQLLMRYLKTETWYRHAFVMPIITGTLIPIVIMDAWIEFYHHTCFPICGLPLVKRDDYIKIDRHKLKYLTHLQKAYCMYCGYANGIMAYWVRIAGVTEQYWCGVQHKKTKNFHMPAHHKDFATYDDEEEWREKYL